MKELLKKLIMAAFVVALLTGSILPSAFAAQYVSVTLPAFRITMNNVNIDNNERQYPIIVYKDITYVPMTYNDSRFLGLETKWSAETGLQVNKITEQTAYNPNRGYSSSTLESAVLPDFRISVNGKTIDNNSEAYPLLVFRDITYFPLTWRFMVNEFGWASSFDLANGLVISSKAGGSASTPPAPPAPPAPPFPPAPPVNENVYSQDFGATTVFIDRASSNRPGNLFVRENNRTRRIGNPRYIYGVGYLQAGTEGEFTPIDKMEFANRWVYTLAVDPRVSPITSRNVRINIDTNEVQVLDAGELNDNSQLSNQVYSRQFGNMMVTLDRASNKQPGNLYVRVNNKTRRIGNPNYIYGVSYARRGRLETYTPVDTLSLTGRWVHTIAVDPYASQIRSRNVRINIDTNEVQILDDNTGNTGNTDNPSDQVYSKQFGNITVLLDRYPARQPGNLYVRVNNIAKKIGNPNYIYGMSYDRRGGSAAYTPVDTLNLTGRWVHTLAIDPSASPTRSRNVRINIDTNEVQLLDDNTGNTGNPSDQVYSRQFGNITVILDRDSNRQPGNLYVRVNNNTKKVGNLNYIYGVSYSRRGALETYNPVNQLSLTGRWISTVAINTSVSPLVSRNVRVNIDTNEVQIIN